MGSWSWHTIWRAPTGGPRLPPANSPSTRTTDWRRKASSAFKGTIPAPWRCAASGSASSHDAGAPGADDVPAVLHLGRVVRDHGHLPRSHPAFQRFADRPRLWRDRHRRVAVAVLYWNHRRSLVRERKTAGGAAPHRRRSHVGGVQSDRVCEVLSAAHPVCPVL